MYTITIIFAITISALIIINKINNIISEIKNNNIEWTKLANTFIDNEIKKEKTKIKKIKEKKSKQLQDFEDANPDIPPHVLHFISGQTNAWNLLRVVIYKMYVDGDLLNFESMIDGIFIRLMKLEQSEYDKLNTEMQIYIEELKKQKSNSDSSIEKN